MLSSPRDISTANLTRLANGRWVADDHIASAAPAAAPVSQVRSNALADMLVRAEVARVQAYAAAAHLDEPELAGVERAVSAAKIVAGHAAYANGKAAIQLHGGMGMTWEVDAHLYLKRAAVLDTAFGSADAHAEALAALVG